MSYSERNDGARAVTKAKQFDKSGRIIRTVGIDINSYGNGDCFVFVESDKRAQMFKLSEETRRELAAALLFGLKSESE